LKATVAAAAEPRLVVAVGDCALGCGEFAGGYGLASETGAVEDLVRVDVKIPGCPPEPAAIVAGLRQVTGR
jgi:Ni,Fe-hydrogenase III small subunit